MSASSQGIFLRFCDNEHALCKKLRSVDLLTNLFNFSFLKNLPQMNLDTTLKSYKVKKAFMKFHYFDYAHIAQDKACIDLKAAKLSNNSLKHLILWHYKV
jgi:hypothetical protein